MNGQAAPKSDSRLAPRWTERLEEIVPAAPRAAVAWLAETGLLTERLRACCGGETGLTLVSLAEARISGADAAVLRDTDDTALVREVELTCDGRPWVFAQTLIPKATLARQRWLSALGTAALGERLAAVPGIERGPIEFTRLESGDRLYHRALRDRQEPPAALWARRSWFALEGDRILVQEVFLPEAHA